MIALENETLNNLASDLGMKTVDLPEALHSLAAVESKFLKDLRINLKNALSFLNITKKEALLIALAASINDKNKVIADAFTSLVRTEGAKDEELAELYGCVSLMNTNNVFYRFRHFTKKDFYQQTPAGIKMGIMVNPLLGKEFFELLSLAISALNGCELCVSSHEESLLRMGTSDARIYDAVRCAAIVRGITVFN